MGIVRIVTDSTCDLPAELIERHRIITVPLTIQFGNDSYRDNMDLTPAEFYARLAKGPFPKTAQPAAGVFEAAYRKVMAEDASGVCVPIFSATLSGTYGSAKLAAEQVTGEFPIEVIDTRSASMGLGYIVVEAAKLAETGASLEVVTARVRELMPRIDIIFVLNTLEFLAAGGRINRARSLLGSVLSIKPILKLDNGELVPLQQPRTRSKAIDATVQWILSHPDPEAVTVLYDGTPESLPEAESVVERLAATIPRERIIINHYGTTYAVHLGPKAGGAIILSKA